MQVSTSLFYDATATAMTRLSAQSDAIQTQISTGKKLQAPSDDSVAYQRLQGIARATADSTVAQSNLGMAASVLSQADTTLSAITTQLQRASELAVEARSGTQDAAGRGAIADELDSIRAQLVTLGNATDPRGQPLFGGTDASAAVTANADGSYTYAATAPGAIPTGDGEAVQPSENATRVFTGGGTDLLATLAALSTAVRAGDDTAAANAETGLAAASTNVSAVQASLGARASRVELDQASLKQADTDRETTRSGLEDTDVTTAITDLQKTMTVLQATQASFTKLSSLSLFDYLK